MQKPSLTFSQTVLVALVFLAPGLYFKRSFSEKPLLLIDETFLFYIFGQTVAI